MDAKYCRYCQQTLPVSDFYQKFGSRDGLEYKCKACIKAYMADRWKNSNAGKEAAIRVAERIATREQRREEKRKRAALAAKAYYAKNIEKCRLSRIRYRQEHKDELSAYHREYRDAHRDELRAKTKIKYINRSEEDRRKARDLQKAQYRKAKAAVADLLGGKCYCCSLDDIRFLTLDHIHNDGHVDRKAGGGVGSLTYLNRLLRDPNLKLRLRLACYNCNCARQYTEGKVCPHQQ